MYCTWDKMWLVKIDESKTNTAWTVEQLFTEDTPTCPGTLGHSFADKNLSSIALTSGSRFTASQYPPLNPHLQTTGKVKNGQPEWSTTDNNLGSQ